MTLHLITLALSFNNYKWVDNPIEVIEKEKTYVVTEDNDEEVMRLIPELIPKSRVNVVMASKASSFRQISLSIYCPTKDITEAKDKLITEITRLSEAYRKGFEQQAEVLAKITHSNE